jgi:methylenetetrahydrofolate reductase (NADPH)
MKIRSKLNPSKPGFSFEFFPPKTAEGEKLLWETLEDLRTLDPTYVSVTYGAGGSTRDRTIDLVSHIKERTGIEAMAHLTCVGHSKDELAQVLDKLAAARIENVLALRGDAPKGQEKFAKTAGGFEYASELVAFIRDRNLGFSVGCAGYPEGHVETASRETDLKNLKTKVDEGSDFVITQLFFDNAFYFDFVERARRMGINVPIVPGIMPITNYDQVQRFVRMCGATVPMRLQIELERIKDEPDAVMQLGVAHATLQCSELLARGVPGIHFYTLNRSPASRMIVTALKARG